MPALGLLVLNLTTGLGLGDVGALGRHWRYRRVPSAVIWNQPEKEGELGDFAPLSVNTALVIREGGLSVVEGGELRPVGPPQGLLRFDFRPGGLWVVGTYHRVMSWDASRGVRQVARASGAVREIRGRGDGLAVAVEGFELNAGEVRFFHQTAPDFFEADGLGIPIALGRWSGFEISPNGRRMLANLPGGTAVGVWDVVTGRCLATWPTSRLARVLAWGDDDRVLFDEGPLWKDRSAIYAHPETRLVLARVGGQEPPAVVVEKFAMVLASAAHEGRLAFADAEGVIRVVALGPQPALVDTFAPKDRGVPWRLRWEGPRLWAHFTGERVRLERYDLR